METRTLTPAFLMKFLSPVLLLIMLGLGLSQRFLIVNDLIYVYLLIGTTGAAFTAFSTVEGFSKTFADKQDLLGAYGVSHQMRRRAASTSLLHRLRIPVNVLTGAVIVLPSSVTGALVNPLLPTRAFSNPHLGFMYVPWLVRTSLGVLMGGILLLVSAETYFRYLTPLVHWSLLLTPGISLVHIFVYLPGYAKNREIAMWHPAATSFFSLFCLLLGVALSNISLSGTGHSFADVASELSELSGKVLNLPSILGALQDMTALARGYFTGEGPGLSQEELRDLHFTSLALLSISAVGANIVQVFFSKRTDAAKMEIAISLQQLGQVQRAEKVVRSMSVHMPARHLMRAALAVEQGKQDEAFEELDRYCNREFHRTYDGDPHPHRIHVLIQTIMTLVRPQNVPVLLCAEMSRFISEPAYVFFMTSSAAAASQTPRPVLRQSDAEADEKYFAFLRQLGYAQESPVLQRFRTWMRAGYADPDFAADYQRGDRSYLEVALRLSVLLMLQNAAYRNSQVPGQAQAAIPADLSARLRHHATLLLSRPASGLSFGELLLHNLVSGVMVNMPVEYVQSFCRQNTAELKQYADELLQRMRAYEYVLE